MQSGNPGELKDEIAYGKVAEFLVRQHFSVVIAGKLEERAPGIRATGGPCRIPLPNLFTRDRIAIAFAAMQRLRTTFSLFLAEGFTLNNQPG